MSTDQAHIFYEVLDGFTVKCAKALSPTHPVLWENSTIETTYLRLVLLGIKEIPSEWRGNMRVKKIEKEGGGEREVLVNPPTMWELRIAVVPFGVGLAERLFMMGQIVRCLRDDGHLPVSEHRWNGLESDSIVATFATENLQDKSMLLALMGELSGLATYYVLTLGLDSAVSREFSRVSERDLRTKKIQED